jgi:hypothetical protein
LKHHPHQFKRIYIVINDQYFFGHRTSFADWESLA